MEALTPEEARVLGSLLEKEAATPECYPLTLNAPRNACNQTSSRHPVVSYDDTTVEEALTGLRDKKLVRIVYSPSNRAAKYRHVMEEVVPVEREGLALLCLLLLRGPQTLGELRSRSERLAGFEGAAEVEAALERLERTRFEDHPEPLVRRLPRLPGQKEVRYAQLLTGEPDETDRDTPGPAAAPGGLAGRVAALEEDVAGLRRDLAELRELLS